MRTRRLTTRAVATLLSLTLVGLATPTQEPGSAPVPSKRKLTEPQDAPAPSLSAEFNDTHAAIAKMLTNRQFDKALQQIDSMIQIAKAHGDRIAAVFAYRARAFALQLSGRYEEAANAWEQVAQVWREIGDGVFVVEALSNQAMCLWQSNRQQAEALVAQALTLAQVETKRPVGMAETLRQLGVDWLSYDGKRAVTRQYYELSFNLCKRYAPESLVLASALINLGALANDQQRYSEAEDYLKQSLIVLEKIEQSRSVEAARVRSDSGVSAYVRGDLDEALLRLQEALEAQVQLNPCEAAITMHRLGNVYADLWDLERSAEYIRRALDIYKRQKCSSRAEAGAEMDLAATLAEQGNLSEARQGFERARQTAQGKRVVHFAGHARANHADPQAQLGLLRKGYADPYQWAGFVLIGDYRTELPRAGSANPLK